MNKLKATLNNPVFCFLALSFAYFFIWDLCICQFVIPASWQNGVIDCVGAISQLFSSIIYKDVFFINDVLFINKIACVYVGIPCNGVETMGVITCIIIAFRAHWFQKLWFILLNCLLILLLNSLRISVLASLLYEHKQSFDINHKYVFNIILYGILLILFALWSQKITIKAVSPLPS